MKIYILTLFPGMFSSIFSQSILKRAIDRKIIKIDLIDIRNFATDKHKTVDDTPYGGGKGMVLKADIIVKALESIKPKTVLLASRRSGPANKPYTVLLSASGKKFDQQIARNLSKKKSLAIICGHYEGVDARVNEYADEVISIGDFVLTGGEIAAFVIIDSVTRLMPGVINPESLENESFSKLSTIPSKTRLASGGNSQLSTLLEYPQYTKPENFRGSKVPKILLSGNHQKIQKWRQKESLKITKKYRQDLLKRSK